MTFEHALGVLQESPWERLRRVAAHVTHTPLRLTLRGRCLLGFRPHEWNVIEAFVRQAVDETMKLEAALARFRMPRRVALLHYAPIQATVEGEPPAIFPYLGSSRLEEPLSRFPVSLVIHGHAHNGQPEGVTSTGTPVHNVALPLMRRISPQRPYRLFELPVVEDTGPSDGPGAR